jgi:hypothetical protein
MGYTQIIAKRTRDAGKFDAVRQANRGPWLR